MQPSPARPAARWQALWRDAVRDPAELLALLGLNGTAVGLSEAAVGSLVSSTMRPQQIGAVEIDESSVTVYLAAADEPGSIDALKKMEIASAAGPVRLDKVATIADGLSAPFAGSVPFAIVEQYVDDLVVVSDAAIREAMILILERCKQLAEPGGAAALAALLAGKSTGKSVCLVLSGGNADFAQIQEIVMRSHPLPLG